MAVVGFDFGYQTCFIAVARQGGIETIANEYSDRTTPSYVSLGEKNRAMGVSAKNQQMANIKNTVFGWKKLIGRCYSDPVTQHEKELLPYDIVKQDDNSIGIRVQYLGESQSFSPEQITAMLLTKLKHTAEANLRTKVKDVVISVPTYFTDSQRRALLDCCKMADLNCLKLLNDTTAVALAYGIYKQDLPEEKDKARNVAFVDLGHSDLQVAITAFNKGKLKMLATSCDQMVGGRDLDRTLADYFADDFKKRYKIDAKNNKRAYTRLLTECEKLKKLMSANSTKIPLNIECFMEDKDVTGKMDRATLEELASPIFSRMEQVLQSVLDRANLKPSDLDSVEIVGGSTRVPAVKGLVQKVFGKEPSTTLNADEAVARGCALQCAILSPTFRVRDFSITDCQLYPITITWQGGVEDGGDMEVFPLFHPTPFSKMLTFYRKEPFTIEAKYSYPNDIPFPTTFIGEFKINDIRPQGDDESSKVKVKVRVNNHGIFTVTQAQMVEKLGGAEEESMEIDQKEENATNGQSQPEASTPDEKNTTTEGSDDLKDVKVNSDEPMQTEEQQQGQTPNTEAPPPDNTDAKQQESKDSKDTKDKKKKKTVKYVDLPIEARVPGLTIEQINSLLEREGQFIAQDRLEKDRNDAKNAVEEYVYEMRDKLCGVLEPYVKEADRERFSGLLGQTEDWLYDEGEDCKKQVYVDKLAELKKLGEPVVKRQLEAELRPAAFEDLGKSLLMVRKALDLYQNKDEKYDHLDAKDMEKVAKVLQEKQTWYEKQLNQQNQRPLTDDPIVLTSQIRQEKQLLENAVNPILNKPKPKVEPPKEEKKEEAKGNGDEKKAEDKPQETPATKPEEGDMDLD